MIITALLTVCVGQLKFLITGIFFFFLCGFFFYLLVFLLPALTPDQCDRTGL